MINLNLKSFNPFLILLIFLSHYLFSLPEQHDVLQGQVSFQKTGNELKVTASDGSIISYANGFNVGTGEIVRFEQPSSNSRVLNRIGGGVPSQIDGKLFGNGQVYLVNPSGVIFGANSVVEVNKLHAIAGAYSSEDFTKGLENYSSLSNSVENYGSITAKEVVLAGNTVKNNGSILAENGIVVFGAGDGLMVETENSDLRVGLFQNFVAPLGSVSDIAGHAVLQSGIVKSSDLKINGGTIVLSGEIKSEKLVIGNFASLDGTSGSVVAKELNLASAQNDIASLVDLTSPSHEIGQIKVAGNYNSIKVRTSGTLNMGELGNPKVYSSDQIDVRVKNGDLNIHDKPKPLNSGSGNAILLASEENLNFSRSLEGLSYARMILFGSNLTQSSYQAIENKPANLVHLYANTITLEELQISFPSSLLQKLSLENSDMNSFTIDQGAVQTSTSNNSQNPLFITSIPLLEGVSTPSSPNSFSSPGDSPTSLPLSESSPIIQNTGSLFSDELFNTAVEYKLFDNYSYYLQAFEKKISMFEILSEIGGVSSIFGGSYDLVSTGSKESVVTEESGDGEGADSSSESGSDSGKSTEGVAQINDSSGLIQSVLPFAPISMPIASTQAAEILNKSLSDQIELKLEKFINK